MPHASLIFDKCASSRPHAAKPSPRHRPLACQLDVRVGSCYIAPRRHGEACSRNNDQPSYGGISVYVLMMRGGSSGDFAGRHVLFFFVPTRDPKRDVGRMRLVGSPSLQWRVGVPGSKRVCTRICRVLGRLGSAQSGYRGIGTTYMTKHVSRRATTLGHGHHRVKTGAHCRSKARGSQKTDVRAWFHRCSAAPQAACAGLPRARLHPHVTRGDASEVSKCKKFLHLIVPIRHPL